MLKVFHSFSPGLTESILEIYQESLSKKLFGSDNNFVEMLYESDCILFLWMVGESYVSCVQCEIHGSQALLYSLETAPSYRGKGFGKHLVFSVIEYLKDIGISTISNHVKKNNQVSLSLHENLGFKISKDCARLMDGTVSQNYYTLIYEI